MTAQIIPITSHPAYHGKRTLAEMVELLERSIERRKDMTERKGDGA